MTRPLHAPALVDDLPALIAHLRGCARADACLVAALPALQARPGAAEAVLAGLEPRFDVWRRRTVFPPRRPRLDEFCALATERARQLDPSFPALTDDGFTEQRWMCASRREKDARVAGRGWQLEVEERDEGPAEAIHVDEWVATARGDGWALRLRYDTLSGEDQLWEEHRTGADSARPWPASER